MTPSRYQSAYYDAAEAGLSFGANSVAMSIEQPDATASGEGDDDGEEEKVTAPVMANGEDMSILSESESNMLTLGSISSKYWMNGLPHIPHANLSRLTSDQYNSIGSWFVDPKGSISSTNRRHQSSSMAMPSAVSLTHVTQTQSSSSNNNNNSSSNNNSNMMNNSNHNNSNLPINDLTMTSITDSVRNMLSIVGEGGSVSGFGGGSSGLGVARKSGESTQNPSISLSHFYGTSLGTRCSEEAASGSGSFSSTTYQPLAGAIQQQQGQAAATPAASTPLQAPVAPRQGILAADFYTPPPNLGSPAPNH